MLISAESRYQHCLWVSKQRLVYLDRFRTGTLSIFEIENYALHLRKICEAIAYGCLAAAEYGYRDLSKSEMKVWGADRILKTALKRNNRCFPQTVAIELNFDTRNHKISDWNPRMPSSELIGVYHECGDVLHEYNPFFEIKQFKKDYPSLLRAHQSNVKALLSNHTIPIGVRTYVGMMGDWDNVPPVTLAVSEEFSTER